MIVSAELLSRYADGEVTPDEARAVKKAVEADPALQSQLDDFQTLAELFGEVEPDEISEELHTRLASLGTARPLARFEAVRTEPVPRRSWVNWAAAAAAVLLVGFGLAQLADKPEVTLKDVARLTIDANGTVVDTRLRNELTVTAGDTLKAGADERLSFRTLAGDVVVLQPGAALAIGDPRDGEIFQLSRGTVLCTVLSREEPRTVLAGPYNIHVQREAHFGIRLQGADVRSAGPGGGERARVTITVSLGSVEVGKNGDRHEVRAYERAILKGGRMVARGHASEDPVYGDLMRSFRQHSHEIVPGYFSGERGVRSIRKSRWGRQAGRWILALTDAGREAASATHLILQVRASRPGPLLLTRVRPSPRDPTVAEEVTVKTAPVGTDWTLIAVPRSAFRAPGAVHKNRKISPSSSRLVRLELRPEESNVEIVLKASLWAARPPAEVVR